MGSMAACRVHFAQGEDFLGPPFWGNCSGCSCKQNISSQPTTDIQLRYAANTGRAVADASTDATALASDSADGAATAPTSAPGPKKMKFTYPYEVDTSLPTDKWIRFDHPKIASLFARIEILELGECLELSNHALLEGTGFEVPWLQDNKYYVAPELTNLKIWADGQPFKIQAGIDWMILEPIFLRLRSALVDSPFRHTGLRVNFRQITCKFQLRYLITWSRTCGDWFRM